MLTMVMVGAVVGGLTLSAVGEGARGPSARCKGVFAALERGQEKLEGLMEGLGEAIVMHTHGGEVSVFAPTAVANERQPTRGGAG